MGPTREELANYFKNNRKYFDELANHYKQTDPDYYNKFIAPFYGTPFTSMSGKKSVRPAIAVLSATMSVFIMGIALFFLVNQNSPESEVDGNENEIESNNVRMIDTLTNIKELSDYEKGIMYYQLGEYEKAEKFLKNVPESSPAFKDAKLKLIDIRKRIADKK